MSETGESGPCFQVEISETWRGKERLRAARDHALAGHPRAAADRRALRVTGGLPVLVLCAGREEKRRGARGDGAELRYGARSIGRDGTDCTRTPLRVELGGLVRMAPQTGWRSQDPLESRTEAGALRESGERLVLYRE